MRKLFLAAVIVGIALFLILYRAEAVSVSFAWDYDFTVDPACSATVVSDCVKEFHLREGGATLLVVSAPTLAGTVEFTRPYGQRIVTVVAVTETGIESDQSNAVEVIARPFAPRNLR